MTESKDRSYSGLYRHLSNKKTAVNYSVRYVALVYQRTVQLNKKRSVPKPHIYLRQSQSFGLIMRTIKNLLATKAVTNCYKKLDIFSLNIILLVI